MTAPANRAGRIRRLPALALCALFALCAAACSAAGAPAAATNRLVIASWNVENLFDPDDDPANPGDDAFTPAGWTRWTPERYAAKIDHLAEIVAAMRPDVLGLAEIENRRVLEDLVRALREKQHYDLPVILHRDGGDERGIDVAILARAAPVATNWLSPVPGQRDILVARFDFDGRPLTVFMDHWKSWAGPPAENIRLRTTEAHAARREIERRLVQEPRAALLAMGDFNDNVDSAVITEEARFVPWGAAAGTATTGTLYNLSGCLAATNRGTFYYAKNRVWNSFDSVSVSPGMLPGSAEPAPWQAVTNAYGPFVLPQQRDADGRPLPFHRVRSKALGDVYLTGYSDHFPIRCVLQPAVR